MKCAFSILLAGTVLTAFAAQAQEAPPANAAPPSSEQSYAADNGISAEEARRRLDELREARRLAGELRFNEGDTFGGMYAEHGPNFRIVALFTEDPVGKLKKYKISKSVVGAGAKQSEKSLREEQKALLKTLRDNGAGVAAQTRVKDGEIDLYTDDEAALAAAVSKAKITLDKKVKIKKVKSLKSDREAAVYAGYPLKEGTVEKCTAGFALTDGTKRYLSTAGHCPNTLNYNGASLPFWFQWYAANNVHDFQVHNLGTNTVSNSIYVGSTTLQKITSVMPYDWMFENDYVCKYGRATFSTCGYISSLNYSALGAGGFVRVHRDGVNLSEGGDSGGPWYLSTYEEAWGVHSDAPFDNANDAFFMPASRFEEANLQVLTTP